MGNTFALWKAIVACMGFLLTCSAAPTQTDQQPQVDFNALLDGSLGNMPALWIASQALLVELNQTDDANSPPTKALAQSAPAPSPSDSDRTDKENGAVMATFISGLMIPAIFSIKDKGPAEGLCSALMQSAGGMTGALVGQEVAKDLYGNDTTASEFEQGVVPGAFFGSIAGNGAGTLLSRALCSKLVPDFGKWWKDMHPDVITKASKPLNRGLQRILSTHLEEHLGVETSRAIQFASQLTETMRLIDHTNPVQAMEYLNNQLTEVQGELARGIAKTTNPPAMPALEAMVRMSTKFSYFTGKIPNQPLPKDPLSLYQRFTSHYTKYLEAAKKIPKLSKVAGDLKQVADGLNNAANKAVQLAKDKAPEKAMDALRNGYDAAKGALKGLPMLPFPGCDGGNDSGSTETHHTTITATATSTSTSTISTVTTVTSTLSTSCQPRTTTATATKTTTITSTVKLPGPTVTKLVAAPAPPPPAPPPKDCIIFDLFCDDDDDDD